MIVRLLVPTHNITLYRNSNNKCRCISTNSRSASVPLHPISRGLMVDPRYQKKKSGLAAHQPCRYHRTFMTRVRYAWRLQPVLRVRAAFRERSEGSSVSEPDFRSHHHSSLSLSISRVVLPNPPAGYHVIFVAQYVMLEAQPSRSTNPYAKAPMIPCRLSGACSGCDARLLSLLCVTNEPITVQNKGPALLFAYREQC